jgi:DNA-binding transcriptional MerR regulator
MQFLLNGGISMKTVTEVSKITGIIPQRINDYEKAGLLEKPSTRNKYQYRLYSDKEIVRLWQIRFYKEPGYTIPQMKRIFTNPTYQPEIELNYKVESEAYQALSEMKHETTNANDTISQAVIQYCKETNHV